MLTKLRCILKLCKTFVPLVGIMFLEIEFPLLEEFSFKQLQVLLKNTTYQIYSELLEVMKREEKRERAKVT